MQEMIAKLSNCKKIVNELTVGFSIKIIKKKNKKKQKVMLFIFVYFIYNGKEELFKFSKI